MSKALTTDEVIELMKKRQGDRTNKEFAAELGVTPAYLSDVYNGRRDIGPSLFEALGLEREIVFRPAV